MSREHGGVTCNGCSRRDFRFRRYKCLVCRDYDLCGTCFDNQQETDKHASYHPMQCLITKADHDVFYCGEGSTKHCVQSFTCSVCGQLGFTESSLSNHVFSNHPDAGDSEVLCPFCAIHTEGDPNLTTHDIASHFKSVHNLSPSVNGKSVVNDPSSVTASLVPRFVSTDNKCFEVASLRTRPTNRPRAHDFGFDKVGNLNCTNTTTFHNRLLVDESCHNQNSANSSGMTSQPVLYNPRFAPGSIVAMKNFLKSSGHDNKNKQNNDTNSRLCDKQQHSCNNKPSNSNRIEAQDSTVLHLDPIVKGTDSQTAADKSPNGETLAHRSNNNQDSANESQDNKQIDDCTTTTTTSASRESKFIENSVLLSPCENENLTNQQNISRADSNGYLESLTSEVLDRKLNTLFPSPSKYTKSLSCDPHIKSVNDDKSKEVNKKLVFNCPTNEHQSELPPVTVQDDWDIDWHMFLNELIWSSLCNDDASSTIT